jgi:hypothetical protein
MQYFLPAIFIAIIKKRMVQVEAGSTFSALTTQYFTAVLHYESPTSKFF